MSNEPPPPIVEPTLACCEQPTGPLLEIKADGTVMRRQRGYQVVALKCAVCGTRYPLTEGFYKP